VGGADRVPSEYLAAPFSAQGKEKKNGFLFLGWLAAEGI
jgi:hypothetical protein